MTFASARPIRRPPSLGRATASVLGVVLGLAGCAVVPAAAPERAAASTAPGDVLQVATSFYALQYAAERVGGGLVEVTSLTPEGVDPHDVELSPRQVRELGGADAVVVLAGFQPAVDEAVATRRPEHVLDVRSAVRLVPPDADPADDPAHAHAGDQATRDQDAVDDHADEAADDDHTDEPEDADDHGHGRGSLAGLDPHFWLDPVRLAAVGHAVADLLTGAAPEHAATFAKGAVALEEDLMALDADYHDGLAVCERDVVVTGHAAFGYLARTYGFTEVGIAGIDPDNEPSPARLRAVRAVLERYDLTTVYTGSTGDASVASTLADALGLQVAVLDPIEVQADPRADYLDVMRANLDALRDGLGCR